MDEIMHGTYCDILVVRAVLTNTTQRTKQTKTTWKRADHIVSLINFICASKKLYWILQEESLVHSEYSIVCFLYFRDGERVKGSGVMTGARIVEGWKTLGRAQKRSAERKVNGGNYPEVRTSNEPLASKTLKFSRLNFKAWRFIF